MEDNRPTYGMRIKFSKQDHLLTSHKIYSNGTAMVRLVIDTERMVFKFVDPATGFVMFTGGVGITNLEVLQRNAKKKLQEFLDIKFVKEIRNIKQENDGNNG